jgi:hypothetical protein
LYFAAIHLQIRDGDLFCLACKRVVKSDVLRYIRQHCFRSQNSDARLVFSGLSNDEKQGLSHFSALQGHLLYQRERESLAAAAEQYRTNLLLAQATEEAAKRSRVVVPTTLEKEVLAARVEVLRALLEAGIPLNKLKKHRFFMLLG